MNIYLNGLNYRTQMVQMFIEQMKIGLMKGVRRIPMFIEQMQNGLMKGIRRIPMIIANNAKYVFDPVGVAPTICHSFFIYIPSLRDAFNKINERTQRIPMFIEQMQNGLMKGIRRIPMIIANNARYVFDPVGVAPTIRHSFFIYIPSLRDAFNKINERTQRIPMFIEQMQIGLMKGIRRIPMIIANNARYVFDPIGVAPTICHSFFIYIPFLRDAFNKINERTQRIPMFIEQMQIGLRKGTRRIPMFIEQMQIGLMKGIRRIPMFIATNVLNITYDPVGVAPNPSNFTSINIKSLRD